MPLQIGCCSDATAKALRMLEYASRKPEVGAAQVTLPYWMELTDREVLRFFQDLFRACPDMPLVHYNIPRAKRYLHAADYRRILEVAPTLIGVKYTFAGSHFGRLQENLALTPELSYFIGEDLLASGMMMGVRGSYSSLVSTNPAFMLLMHQQCERGRWPEAIAMQKGVAAFYRDLDAWLGERGEGGIDPVVDKGLSVAAGFFVGSQRCRPPYIGWSDETVGELRELLRQRYPEFLFQP
jgi:dihydrodipicolinate synthase/N-acetylneuraminate lyase